MRVCFNGLCFATQKPADSTDEDDDTTTVVVTTGSPVAPVKSAAAQPNGRDIYRSLATLELAEKQPQLTPEKENDTQANTNRTVFNSRTEFDQMERPDASNPFVVVAMEDPLPAVVPVAPPAAANGLPPAVNQIAGQMGRLEIDGAGAVAPASQPNQSPPAHPASPAKRNDGCAGADDGAVAAEQHYKRIVQERDAQIAELQTTLQRKEDEIAELKSHLDKFQSVFPFSRGRKTGTQQGGAVQRQRAQGISAEPQNESQVMELMNQTFPKYDKQDR